MRRRSRNKTETYAEVTNPTTNTTDVPVSPNEAYGLTKITRPREEVTYELVKLLNVARIKTHTRLFDAERHIIVAKHARVCKLVYSSLRHHLQELRDVGDEVKACLNSTVDTTIMCV